jgi:hypothetical protein
MKLNPGLPLPKQPSTGRRLFLTRKMNLNFRNKLVKSYVWSRAMYGAETWTLRKVYQKYLESFEIWWWRRLEKISCADLTRGKVTLIGHFLRRNCLLKHTVDGKTRKKTLAATG